MTDAGDPRGQDRGYYGAGWSQPAPGTGPYAPGQQGGAQQGGPQHGGGQPGGPQQGGQPFGGPSGGGQPFGAPAAPQQRRRRPDGDPRRAFAPGASVANTTGALIAVVSVVVVEFLSGLIGLLGTALVVHPFSSSVAGNSLLGGFVQGVFVAPLPFYVGAFVALAFLVPVARRSPLPVILLRAALAGAAGTVALALVGIVEGAFGAVRGSGVARLVFDVVAAPLQAGLPLTLMLLATAAVAWLWTGRPRGGARRALGAPGTVRRPDAVPPATVQGPAGPQPVPGQSVPGQSVPGPYGAGQPVPGQPVPGQPAPGQTVPQRPAQGVPQQYGGSQAPYGGAPEQPPADRWAPPQR